MVDFLVDFIRLNPKLVLAAVGVLVALLGLSVAKTSLKTNRENRHYDKLEADSLYQIEENLKEIQKVLEEPIEGGDGHGLESSLNKLLTSPIEINNKEGLNKALSKLSQPFARFCANLEKYHDNIMPRKGICMIFQEYENKARSYLRLFEHSNYDDVALGFAKLHLQQADISY